MGRQLVGCSLCYARSRLAGQGHADCRVWCCDSGAMSAPRERRFATLASAVSADAMSAVQAEVRQANQSAVGNTVARRRNVLEGEIYGPGQTSTTTTASTMASHSNSVFNSTPSSYLSRPCVFISPSDSSASRPQVEIARRRRGIEDRIEPQIEAPGPVAGSRRATQPRINPRFCARQET
jgi:hypothetical protein